MTLAALVADDGHAPTPDQLPRFPAEWRLARFRHVFNFNKGLTITKENLQDEGIPCVSYGDVHSKYGFEVDPDRHPLKCVDASYMKNNQSSLLRRGDFVFADTSEDIEGSGNFTCYSSERQAFAGYHTLIAKPKVPMSFRFMAYLLDSTTFRAQVQTEVTGVKVFSISQAVLKPTFVWFPPEQEQDAIAAFLDEKCAKVDEAVRIKEEQIARLRERRQILIQEAVTRGLNPTAPMKDSRIDWIGQIPAHWEQLANKHIFRLRKTLVGKRSSEYELLSLTLRGVIKRDMENPEGKFPAEFDTYQEVRPGDFVFCHFDVEETPRTVGLSEFFGMITGAYTVYSVADGIDPRFLLHFYIFADTDKKMRSLYKGLRNTIPKEAFGAFKTPLPPIEEQREIVAHIDEASRKIEDAIAIKANQIAALKEYKTSLINAAVTGKIKVA
ncbi:restriction endonuclease subunit S [Brevundimonas vancanneytii]|uniref:EcoKI restriction-modification system protein HsdS n=1 Tax=Brevundimonas vancanneytii TaxID=1325724 RepID=A0A4P1KJI6_9CAUL|nr:restriction endonuclease subunit S [Brevundimonas vancanneytii]VTO19753.1 EcoKI restriction-modification system protein HsdS [Brevundimonas vancanneytii]